MSERNYRTSAKAAIPARQGALPQIDVTGMQTALPDKLPPGSSRHPRASQKYLKFPIKRSG